MHELTRSEDPAHGVHLALLGLVADARHALSGRELSDESIHQSRKSLKKCRAALRLLRDAISESVFQRENRVLRDIARPLSAARDASVLLETLSRLEKLYGPAARESIPASLRKALKAEEAEVTRGIGHANGKRPPAGAALKRVERRLARMTVARNGWDDVGNSLKRVYRGGRRAMKDARSTPTAECLHEWRKQTKHLWHQLQLLEPLWPGTVGELADQAHRLSDYLGDDHDLAVLRETVDKHRTLFTGSGGAGALLALIDRCRSRLQEKAFLLGGRIYDERPTEFAARFGRFWKRWRRESARQPALSAP